MNTETLDIVIISARNMITEIKHALTNVRVFNTQEDLDIFPWMVSQMLQQSDKGKTLLKSLNEVFRRIVAEGLDTIELTKTIHSLEILMIELDKELNQEIDMSLIKY